MKRKTFCNTGCRDSYRADRRHGLIYGAVLTCEKEHRHSDLMADGCWTDHEEFRRQIGHCPYCGAKVAR